MEAIFLFKFSFYSALNIFVVKEFLKNKRYKSVRKQLMLRSETPFRDNYKFIKFEHS